MQEITYLKVTNAGALDNTEQHKLVILSRLSKVREDYEKIGKKLEELETVDKDEKLTSFSVKVVKIVKVFLTVQIREREDIRE